MAVASVHQNGHVRGRQWPAAVDLPVLAWLLRSVSPQTRLIFVGDKDQLASVGPGSVLRDLLAIGQIPVTLLTVIKRQVEGSPIVEAAHAINHGQLPVARSTAAGDLYILRAKPAKEDDGAQASGWWPSASAPRS
jgi:exodeoxyribonuclease V alpha subunit